MAGQQRSEGPTRNRTRIQTKVINDPIHGTVELHPLLIKIIDTLQFQRLRFIKQLGGTYFVYPGASHNRFEHSIGVAHLAGKLVKALKTRQPELNIDDRDILCVQIAGLCHDLGHGPFSHLFDDMFLQDIFEKKKEQAQQEPAQQEPAQQEQAQQEPAQQESTESTNQQWKHEKGSREMFDHLVKCNELKPIMEEYGLVPDVDLKFIKEMIAGPDPERLDQNWPYEGRTEEKSFLYEIVANKQNGIDVDKFDYLTRDCYYLGIQNNFDHRRFLKFAKVLKINGRKHICVRDKEESNLYDLFHTRLRLHRNACHHRVNTLIQAMIKDAFLKADKHIKIRGLKGKMFTLSTAIEDPEAYTKLTDSVFEQILHSSSPELAESREILQNIHNRKLYKFVGETKPKESIEGKLHRWKEELPQDLDQDVEITVTDTTTGASVDDKEMIRYWKKKLHGDFPEEDFMVTVIPLNYGMKGKNPITSMYFYSKDNPDKAFKIPNNKVSMLLPASFSEYLIRVYWKKTDDPEVDLKAEKKRFIEWCQKNDFETPQTRDFTDEEQN